MSSDALMPDLPPAEEQRDNSGPPVRGRPFPPGQSGNPGGRPKGRSITDRLRALLDHTELSGTVLPRPIGDLLAETIVKHALKGHVALIRELLERTEGKVMQRLTAEVSGPGGGPISVAVNPLDQLDAGELEALDGIARKLALGSDQAAGGDPAGASPP